MPQMREAQGIHPALWPLSHLLQGAGSHGDASRSAQGKLVRAGRALLSGPSSRRDSEGTNMPVSDPIADMLTRIRNAVHVRHDTVTVPASNTKIALAKILREEGFIEGYDVLKGQSPQGLIKLYLHYRGKGEPAIAGLKRVSRPGLRVYVRKGEIPRYFGGLGVAILSTSQGMLTGREAWRKGIGGELLCYVW